MLAVAASLVLLASVVPQMGGPPQSAAVDRGAAQEEPRREPREAARPELLTEPSAKNEPREAERPEPLAPPSAKARPFPSLFLRFPLADLPFNAEFGGSFPSMQQSLHLVGNLAQTAHHSIVWAIDGALPRPWSNIARALAILLVDVVLVVPLIWLHEEWHRAVMSHRGISSHNDVYDLRIVSGTIAVSHVADADLVRLKRDHPSDMVRLSSAGMESELELVRHFQKSAVFHGTPAAPDLVLALYSVASVVGYRATCASSSSNRTTDALNAAEGADIAVRDFTGLDCLAWTYDLHHPNEPYEARGVHPSGVGLDRYIRYADLTAGEQRVMRQVRNLGFLNFVSPYLFGFGRFTATSPFDGRPFAWNAALRHHLTTYGHDLTVDVFLARERTKLLLAYHHGMNARGAFPTLEAELVRLPFSVSGGGTLHANATLMAWLQPERQSFLTDQATFGGLIRAGIDVPVTSRLDVFFELEAKTQGFVAGVLEVGPALAFRSGAALRL